MHLWRFQLDWDAWAPASEGSLSTAESRRAERFHRDRDRRAFLARRTLVRALLGAYLDRPPASLELASGPFGKPELGSKEFDLTFNWSVTGSFLALAVARNLSLGVDLEWRDPALELERLAPTVMGPEELVRFRALPAAERPAAFFRLWTRKEALVKALGVGFRREPKGFFVGLDAAPWGLLQPVSAAPEDGGAWGLVELEPERELACALVAAGHDWTLALLPNGA